MSIGLSVTSYKLYNGRRSLYIALHFFRRRVWLMRWDTARTTNPLFVERGGVMAWSAGIN
jgi:hypothetical protein